MIFVTVGTTAFDTLIGAVDNSGIKEEIVIQKADGDYLPQNYRYFEFTDKFEDYYEKAGVVITHGGAGTLFNLLPRGTKIVAVANEDRIDLHQSDILQKLSDENYLTWCQDPKNIADCVTQAKTKKFKKYQPPECTIDQEIRQFLG